MTLFIADGRLNSVAKADCPNCHGEGFVFVQNYSPGHYSTRYEACNCITVIGESSRAPEGTTKR